LWLILVRSSSVRGRSPGCASLYHACMEAPGITRHRRPFLAPLWVGLLGALLLAGIAWTFFRGVTTTVVVLVSPTPKDPGTIDDPPLSAEGEARAQRLVQMFGAAAGGGAGLDAVYESEDRRAQQTAAPLAERLHRAPVVFKASEARAVAARMLREHAGGTVLVVASGAAGPQVIQELLGAERNSLAEDPNTVTMLSVPSFGRAHLMRIGY
jgi:phosphohistidine phosphatase SixA